MTTRTKGGRIKETAARKDPKFGEDGIRYRQIA